MLNLPLLKQIGVTEHPDQYEITVAGTGSLPECKCNSGSLVRNGTKTASYVDTPMHGKRVSITLRRQRFKCTACGATVYADVEHMHERHRMTHRCYQYICNRGARVSWTAMADEIGIDAQTVADIWNAYADRELAAFTPITPDWLGIDELYIMGKYRAVITNVRSRTLVDMLPERDIGSLRAYFTGRFDPSTVEVVTMDMWDAYRKVCREQFPNAVIVVDRFHVMAYASKAIETTRKALRRSLDKKHRVNLLGDRWLMLTGKEKLPADRAMMLEAVLEQYPALKEVYHLKEEFRTIWDLENREAADKACDAWEKSVVDSPSMDVFLPLLSCLKNWRQEILNYVDWKVTNAYTESFNALARRMDRKGNGYSFDALRKRLLLHHGSIKQPPAEVACMLAKELVLFIDEGESTWPRAGVDEEGNWVGPRLSTLARWLSTQPGC